MTYVYKGQLSPIIDETFIFEMPFLTKEQLETLTITIDV